MHYSLPSEKQEWCHMQLTHWLSLCALVGGASVVLIEPLLGGERVTAFIGVDTDLQITAGAVALVGVLTMLIGDRESKEFSRGKGSPS